MWWNFETPNSDVIKIEALIIDIKINIDWTQTYTSKEWDKLDKILEAMIKKLGEPYSYTAISKLKWYNLKEWTVIWYTIDQYTWLPSVLIDWTPYEKIESYNNRDYVDYGEDNNLF